MKFTINYPGGNINNLMRKIGYFFIRGKSGPSYIRPLEKSGYPRFHIYIDENPGKEEVLFNLHLDQKRPIYRGTTAHSGEYDGSLVEQEKERIKQILKF